MRYLAILLASAVLAAPLCLGLALWLAPAPIAAEYWVRELLVVKRFIASEHQARRKVIVASGSSTLFGVDSAQLAADLGVDAINLGLHAELPLRAVLDESARAAAPGDAVILALEDRYYCDAGMSSWEARNLIAWQPDTWRAMPLAERARALTALGPSVLPELIAARAAAAAFPRWLASRSTAMDDARVLREFAAASPPASFAYSAFHLNRRGDMQATEGPGYFGGSGPSPEAAPAFCETSAAELAAFVARMRARSVVVFFANTPAVDTGHLDPARIAQASKRLADSLAPYGRMLDTKAEVVFPRKLFFNTFLHLNADGRRVRTRLLAQAIRREPGLMRQLGAPPSG